MDCSGCHPAPDGPKHLPFSLECLLSMYRGLRNGVMAGARIRLPYILNALAYALIFRTPEYVIANILPSFNGWAVCGPASSS